MTKIDRKAPAFIVGALLSLAGGATAAQSSILATIPDPAAPSQLRSQPAETTAAAAVDPQWSVP
ncbi:MAG: hypothetical protein PVF50_09655, partial [Gammaproteobacteria bacterium]